MTGIVTKMATGGNGGSKAHSAPGALAGWAGDATSERELEKKGLDGVAAVG